MADSTSNSNKCYQNACSTWTLPLPPTAAVSSSAAASPPDEFSLFLQQILLRSSSSAAPHSSPSIFSDLPTRPPPALRLPDQIFTRHSSSSAVLHDPPPSCPTPSAPNASSTSLGASDHNANDDFDCESEEGLEALVEEVPTKRNPRSSSKRSRAAEVHNLSEKRRRSRINEKMKALQNLIPNSNKTDKASMLDEAIEYLKQLQLQVQMLSMKHGLSLHPMNLAGSLQYVQLSHMRMDFGGGNKSVPSGQERPNHIFPSLPDQRAASVHPFMPDIGRETPFELEPSIQAHLIPIFLSESSKGVCRAVPQDHQVNVSQSDTTPFVSRPYNIPAPGLQELQNSVSVEPCIIEGSQSASTGEDQLKQQSCIDKDC